MSRNIVLCSILKFLRSALFIMPVIVLFFESRGLSMTEIFLLQSIFAAGVVLLEIPTGYLGDMLTRKQGLILWAVFKLFWWILYFYAWWFRSLAIAEITLALWFCFASGTDTALLYDSLLAIGKEDESKQYQAHNNAFANFGEAAAALLGGRIASFHLDRPVGLQIIMSSIAIILSLFLVEPPRERYKITETGPKHLLGIIRYALFTHSKISTLIIVSACVGLSTMFRVWIAQSYRTQISIPVAWFGFLRAVANASVGIFSLFAHRLEKRRSDETLLILLIPLSILGYLSLSSIMARWILPMMFCFYAVRGIKSVVIPDMMNKLISSKERATILSVESLTFRALFMVFGPLAWITIDHFGIQGGLLAIAILLACLWCICIFLLRRSEIT